MPRTTQRVQFQGHAGNTLAGILELPRENPLGFVLFSHCFTCNKDLKAIVRISRELAERGWGVLRYDFSGLGGSSGDFSQTNFSTNRRDLQLAIDFLASEYAYPTFLMGHSFGGAASMSMAQASLVQGVVAVASPSDTCHLADLLQQMDPSINGTGTGEVTIGGRKYRIEKQMIDDFRSHDLQSLVRSMTKPLLVFHSPTDETVGFFHAKLNCGWDDDLRTTSPKHNRSLISLPNCNHLLTTSDEDCRFVAEMSDAWFRRILAAQPTVFRQAPG